MYSFYLQHQVPNTVIFCYGFSQAALLNIKMKAITRSLAPLLLDQCSAIKRSHEVKDARFNGRVTRQSATRIGGINKKVITNIPPNLRSAVFSPDHARTSTCTDFLAK